MPCEGGCGFQKTMDTNPNVIWFSLEEVAEGIHLVVAGGAVRLQTRKMAEGGDQALLVAWVLNKSSVAYGPDGESIPC